MPSDMTAGSCVKTSEMTGCHWWCCQSFSTEAFLSLVWLWSYQWKGWDTEKYHHCIKRPCYPADPHLSSEKRLQEPFILSMFFTQLCLLGFWETHAESSCGKFQTGALFSKETISTGWVMKCRPQNTPSPRKAPSTRAKLFFYSRVVFHQNL